MLQKQDSFVHGAALQEIGISYFYTNKYDTAIFYLNKSLFCPYRGNNYAIRCIILADVYYESEKYDSAMHFATKAFDYPTTFFVKRDCYRILGNTEYTKGNYNKAKTYMSSYQECTDSVRKVEIQTKSTILENLHDSNKTISTSKKFLLSLITIIFCISPLGEYVYFLLRKRNENKQKQLESVEKKLITNQTLLKEGLIKKIEENKQLRSNYYKKASPIERQKIDK